MNLPVLSILIWVSILGGLGLFALPNGLAKSAKTFALTLALITFGITVGTLARFDSVTSEFQLVEKLKWIPNLGISYHLGVDSIAIWMIGLTTLLTLVSVIIADPQQRLKSFYGLLLMLQGTIIAVFSSLDLVQFYIFFELSLVPVTFLILGWGNGDKVRAATKYLAVLFGGSLLMLVGILVIGWQMNVVTGKANFDFVEIQNAANAGLLWMNASHLQTFAFLGFTIAFLFKAPAVPFHTWIVDAYESSPVSAIVSGLVIKVGTFGLFRFCLPLFPDAVKSWAIILSIIGAAGVIYGGILAVSQKHIHRLMAYSTVSHVGFILVGVFSLNHTGMMGAAFQQFNHGVASAAIFVLLAFYYRQGGSPNLDEVSGVKNQMPVFSTLFLIAVLCNLGLPPTSGFVGEFLALMGSFQAGFDGVNGIKVGVSVVAGGGAVLSAAYMLYAFQRMFYGNPKSDQKFVDLVPKEVSIAGIFTALILGLGIAPTYLLKQFQSNVTLIRSSAKPELRSDVKAVPASAAQSTSQQDGVDEE